MAISIILQELTIHGARQWHNPALATNQSGLYLITVLFIYCKSQITLLKFLRGLTPSVRLLRYSYQSRIWCLYNAPYVSLTSELEQARRQFLFELKLKLSVISLSGLVILL